MSLKEKLRILVVDDMSTSRGLLTQALDAIGISQVVALESATNGLRSLETNPVHLVISDFNMPDINGLQFLHALRSQPKTKGVGFILVTGKTEKEIIEAGKRLGMNNFLRKPFEVVDLKKCIEAVVGPL